MRHVVAWPRAKFLVNGERVVVPQGHDVPAGVDPSTLHELVTVGGIVIASPRPGAPAAVELEPDPVTGDVLVRPAKNAKVADWRAYAASALSVAEAEAAAMKKEDIIALADAADSTQGPQDTTSPVEGEDVTAVVDGDEDGIPIAGD